METKADKATTLKGYGITDAYTKKEADDTFATKASLNNKADKATTLAGYGITDAYTKTETDDTFATKSSLNNKADKATTLAGYGITNAYTKTETTAAINQAIAVKADKATTLAGYGITDAYTKTEADAAHAALSERIGTIREDGIIIEAGKNISENLTKIDTALKSEMGKVQELVAGKANTDAGNVGVNAATDNSAVWGAALGTGKMAAGDDRLMTGGTMYSELRPSDGHFVKQANTTAQNLTALDKTLGEVKTSSDNIIKTLQVIEMGTDLNFDLIVDIADEIEEKTKDIDTLKNMDGVVAPAGSSKADEFVRGVTVYNEVRPADGEYVKKDNSTAENLTALDKQVKINEENIAKKANAADVYTKSETDSKFAQKANTLAGYGIKDSYTKTEVDNALGGKADKATTLKGYGITDAYTKTEVDNALGDKADKATTLKGYGITDAYTKEETNSTITTAVAGKADRAATLEGYGITDAYTKAETDDTFATKASLNNKADKATTLAGYGITDAYTKTEADDTFATKASLNNKADKASTLAGYGITDAYTKSEADSAIDTAVEGKADKATTLAGYGIADAYTAEQTDNAISKAIVNKADKATTLAGYGITDAYTKSEADSAIDTAVAGKADKATTLAGYGITDAYTKTEADSAIDTAVEGKADRATTLEGYGITDAYTKTATDNAISKAVVNKADKASTLKGYGITDAYTKSETAGAIKTAVEGKADKADTLAGYGITDAYTKTETDAVAMALSDRIGTIGEDGLIIRTDKNIAENLTLIDQALQDQTGIARDALDKKADADASNVGRNAKDANGSAADNSEAWGSALGTGSVENGNGKLVTGAAVYSEVRPAEDGEYVKKDRTTAANLTALDAQVKSNADAVALNAKNIESNTENIAGNTRAIATNADNIVTAQETADMAMTGVEMLLVGTGISIEGIVAVDEKLEALAGQNGEVKEQGDHADEFVRGATVYEYLNGKPGEEGSLRLGENTTKIAIGRGSEIKSGTRSVALGFDNTVDGDQNIAIGTGHTLKGNNNIAIGDPINIDGSNNGVFGNGSTITGSDTFVMGNGSNVTGSNNIVLGNNVQVNNVDNAVVLGNNSTAEADAVSVGSSGGERQIKHVAPGTEATDAATIGQLQAAGQNTYNNDVYLNNRINKLDNRVNKVGAGAAALAALHPLDMDGKFGMGLGYGNYRNANAMAMGLFYQPKDNLMFSIGGSMGNGENMVNAGVIFALDKGKGLGASKAAMARKIAAQDAEIAALKEAHQKESAAQDEKIAAQDAEIAALKEALARLEAKVGK